MKNPFLLPSPRESNSPCSSWLLSNTVKVWLLILNSIPCQTINPKTLSPKSLSITSKSPLSCVFPATQVAAATSTSCFPFLPPVQDERIKPKQFRIQSLVAITGPEGEEQEAAGATPVHVPFNHRRSKPTEHPLRLCSCCPRCLPEPLQTCLPSRILQPAEKREASLPPSFPSCSQQTRRTEPSTGAADCPNQRRPQQRSSFSR